MLRQTGGSLEVALAVWLIGGVLSFLGALTYAELGAMNPDAGGLYSYIRDAFGPLPAFLYGWASIARHRERLDRRAGRGVLELSRPAHSDRTVSARGLSPSS